MKRTYSYEEKQRNVQGFNLSRGVLIPNLEQS
jgi:hypothetical protein